MTEILFYHLERRSLEDVLPPLLEKCMERGWRVVVQASSNERCKALDSHLWAYHDDSFLPHGLAGDAFSGKQPICLTTGPENPNAANIRFLVEMATPEDVASYERVVHIFDGADDAAVLQARDCWKAGKETGHAMTYWQQDDRGRWQKKG